MSTNCPDCGAAPGCRHKPGCDVERCPYHPKRQAISCFCQEEGHQPPEHLRLPWQGEWPGKAECREQGLWCHSLYRGRPVDAYALLRAGVAAEDIQWHVPCEADAPFASEDLNRWAAKR